jgi:hypothetical protein
MCLSIHYIPFYHNISLNISLSDITSRNDSKTTETLLLKIGNFSKEEQERLRVEFEKATSERDSFKVENQKLKAENEQLKTQVSNNSKPVDR